MSNVWTIGFIGFILTLLSKISLSLELTEDWSVIDRPTNPDALETDSAFEALINIINWVTSALGSYFQILTFQSGLPEIFAIIFIVTSFMILYIIIIVIRGGAG